MSATGRLRRLIDEAYPGDTAAQIELKSYLTTADLSSTTAASAAATAAAHDVLLTNFANVQASNIYRSNLPVPSTTTNTNYVAGTAVFQYVGRVPKTVTTAKVVGMVNVVAGGTLGYAELGIFKGTITAGTTATLTKVSVLSVATAAATNVQMVQSFTGLTGVTPGTDLWITFAATAATTVPQFEAHAPDLLQTAIVQSTAVRPTTITSTTTALAATTVSPGLFYVFI